MTWFEHGRQWARGLKAQTLTLYLACRDPRVPWYAKLLGAAVVAYALSPIDLIPDFIPIVGYVDDLIIVPLGLALTIRMIPPPVLAECAREAERRFADRRPRSWAAGAVVVLIWVALLAWFGTFVFRTWIAGEL